MKVLHCCEKHFLDNVFTLFETMMLQMSSALTFSVQSSDRAKFELL